MPLDLLAAIGLAAVPLLCAGGADAAQPAVVIESIRPSKALYQLNQDASAQLLLTNKSGVAQQVTLVVTEHRGLDDSREVGRIPFRLAANAVAQEVTLHWNVGPWMYGRGIRAALEINGQEISSASEFYQVADQWLRVNMITAWEPAEHLPQDLGLFETYNNHGMQFAWAPDDFSEMTPDVENWYSGQAMYPKSIAGMKAAVDAHHALGSKISTYAKYMFGGPQGFEFARQHPEWVLREPDGSFFNYSSPISPLELAWPITRKPPFWQYGVIDFSDVAVAEYGAREILASARIFGWDGVMFDGHFFAHEGHSWDGAPAGHGESLDELSARNTRLCRDIIRKELPNFSFWYNGTYRRRGDQSLELIIAGGPKTMEACLEDPNSSMLVEKQGPGFMEGTWRHWYDWYADQPGYGEVVQRHSSVVNSGWLWNMGVLDDLSPDEAEAARGAWVAAHHMGSLFLAFNLHPCWNTTYASRPFAQFMTRYSDLLWDVDIRRIDAAKAFQVKSARELWWERSAYVKGSEPNLYLLHLLNTPTTEKPVWSVPDDPPPATDVEVIFRVPDGETVAKAWALRPYQWAEDDRLPVAVELEMQTTPDGVQVNLPAFDYYTLAVFQLEK